MSENKPPRHIAFIMDGNGRWAKMRNMPRENGHKEGAKTFRKVVDMCKDRGIDAITFYAFSSENWKRPKHEVDAIMLLFRDYLIDALDEIVKNDVRIVFLGDRTPLAQKLITLMDEVEQKSKNNKLLLNIAINYGGKQEIVTAVNKALKEGKTEITEEDIQNNLYTVLSGDPDLIVRTGGEIRISNYLIWQSAYSEFYFTDVLWPDFDEKELDKAIGAYMSRQRRFGGLAESGDLGGEKL
ncbi:MAG: di-trans,poly-cis-decaprenylcistransferase [Clostridia bacterium]|nr:di-trans,poly-cis-decaprenylcistransferase [Clostridia bacterium]